MNCPGKNSHVLFNFNNQNHVIITEGIFDALRVGDNGVALLGKIIKKEQLNIILKSKVKKVTILLDKDAFKDANLISDKLSGFSFEVRLAFPNTSKDPGELRPEQIDEIIKEAWNEVR
jgi:DNA primase